jgi:hypothetical protein
MLPRGGQTSAQSPDAAAALLVEVRGLRLALEELASAAPRVQLLFGRLQLQEQRVAGQLRRLEMLRDRIKSADREAQNFIDEVTQTETHLKTPLTDPERQFTERHLAVLRKEAARATAARDALRSEELNVSNEIAVEQGRWTEINQRLEELERALTRR